MLFRNKRLTNLDFTDSRFNLNPYRNKKFKRFLVITGFNHDFKSFFPGRKFKNVLQKHP